MAFASVEFPLVVGRLGASPEFSTTVIPSVSGAEQRTANWANARRRYNAGVGIRNTADITTLIKFFSARLGRYEGFYVKDWTDYQATNQGTGTYTNGGATTLQLIKTYTSGSSTYTRNIVKPKSGATTLYGSNAGAGWTNQALTQGTHYTLDYTTGIITFIPGAMPAGATLITGTFEFYVPVRFDADKLDVDLMLYRLSEGIAEVTEVPLVEIQDFQ